MKQVFTTGQIARLCDVAPRTVSKWIDAGRLRGYRIPGSNDRRVPRENLIRFLKENGMPLYHLVEEGQYRVLLAGVPAAERLALARELPAGSGFAFLEAHDAFGVGLAVAAAEGLDAAVIDLSLGRSEGASVARRLRSDGRFDGLLLVALAGEDESGEGWLLKQGFDEVFKRPVGLAAVAGRVREAAAAKWAGDGRVHEPGRRKRGEG